MDKQFIISVLTFALFPAVAMTIGGIIASYYPPKSKLKSVLHHFTAGVVFAVVGVELLPDVMKEHNIFTTSIGFALGVILMIGMKYVLGGNDEHKEDSLSLSMFAGVAIDVLIDGLLIGIVFSAGAKEGFLLAIALTIEMFSLGMALATSLSEGKLPKKKAILSITGLSLSLFVGAGIGATVLQYVSKEVLETVLAFGLAALLFLVVEELLIEAHEEPETPLITATFFIGFLLFLIIGMIL